MEPLKLNLPSFVVNRSPIVNYNLSKRKIYMKVFLLIFFALCATDFSTYAQSRKASRKFQYDMIGLEDVIRRYIVKDAVTVYPLEGMYSVTCTVVKRYKSWPWKVDKEKIVLLKENYAKVAILKDWPDSSHEFIEISLNQNNVPKLPIVGEFNQWKEGEGYIYKHTEPKGGLMSFTFLFDKDGNVLEGVRSEILGSKTIIYTLTYVKIFPKSSVDTFVNND